MSLYILELRKELNITQTVMANILGITSPNLRAIEQGNRPMPLKAKKLYYALSSIPQQDNYKAAVVDVSFELDFPEALRLKFGREKRLAERKLAMKAAKLENYALKVKECHVMLRSLNGIALHIKENEYKNAHTIIELNRLKLSIGSTDRIIVTHKKLEVEVEQLKVHIAILSKYLSE